MTISRGDKLPDVPLTIATAEGPRPTTTTEFFAGKRVALFAVPGAYTPTCSAKHLPSFIEKAAELKGKGVEAIACTSVNDPFVMAAWARDSAADGIVMLSDGNGQLAGALGLSMDAAKFGMGTRSQRYSMIVNDGVVEQLNVEEPGDYRVSGAEAMLEQL